MSSGSATWVRRSRRTGATCADADWLSLTWQIYFQNTAKRINSLVKGDLYFKPSDISQSLTRANDAHWPVAMLQLCAYETDAIGYSAFCPLFTESDFEAFEY